MLTYSNDLYISLPCGLGAVYVIRGILTMQGPYSRTSYDKS